ncbi:RNA 2',3'-cyclic phosphodiesterase [Tabrizicola thermarum]|uniref:RNA 2',3'-cyclic phosphodiesterase n=1 Tax=Tabrizicola thermarum TaxID=2670345 RepID=UPI000FFB6952|nr:RNA 2',3'-cyclic phosphodiesterase [Tabrizicola thermarum]
MIRAFLGIDLPQAVRGALQVQQVLMALPRKVEAQNLHLTLVFLGECPEPVLDAAHEGFDALRERRFTLSLQGLGLFGKARPHTVWAGVAPSAPLTHLQAKVETIARRAGCPIDARKFVPHVTLGRLPAMDPADTARLEQAVARGAGFRSEPWEVSELTLWRSHLTARGPQYEVLVRYPLG